MSSTRLFLLLQVFLPFVVHTQTVPDNPVLSAPIPEVWPVLTDGDVLATDPVETWELAEAYREALRPMPDLNELTLANAHQYAAWLSPQQQTALIEHIRLHGALESVYELQAVPGFDSLTVRRLIAGTTVRPPGGFFRSGSGPFLDSGKRHQLLLRWARGSGAADTSFAGCPDRLAVRYRWQGAHGRKVQLSVEKDPGETLLPSRQPPGFDHVAGYVSQRREHGILRKLILGNYLVAFGQGLVAHQGFAPGKRLGVSQVRRVAPGILPYASLAESGYMRGCAVQLSPTERMVLRLFHSYRKQDGRIGRRDDGEAYFSNFSLSGLHRTASEREAAGTIPHHTTGMSAEFSRGRGKVGIHGLLDFLPVGKAAANQVYRRFGFSGNLLRNLGFDYGWTYRNLMFFGEIAASRPGGTAQVHGLVIAADRRLDISLLFRRYDRDYAGFHANGLSESGETSNETGFYAGIDLALRRHWQLQATVDLYRFPWLRYRVSRPEYGQEAVLRLSYTKRKGFGCAWQLRHSRAPRDLASEEDGRSVFPRQLSDLQLRYALETPVGEGLILRGRMDVRRQSVPETALPVQWGFHISTDLLYRSLAKPYSFGIRHAIFHTASHDVRIYAYERGLQGEFSFPALHGQGMRWSIHAAYRPRGSSWQMEAWLARQLRHAAAPGAVQSGFLVGQAVANHELRGQLKFTF
ncbi:MAG: hypothetical protein RLY31_3108 [Bacteroidota bacterium]